MKKYKIGDIIKVYFDSYDGLTEGTSVVGTILETSSTGGYFIEELNLTRTYFFYPHIDHADILSTEEAMLWILEK